MNGQLVQVCCPSGSPPELIDPVENSSREVVELCAEVERLRRENLEFHQQRYWKSRYRDTLLRNAALEQKVEQLEGEKRQLQADLFGRRSESTPLKDRSNHLDDPQDDTRRQKRKRHDNKWELRTSALSITHNYSRSLLPARKPAASKVRS